MGKQSFSSELVIGQTISDEPFLLKSIGDCYKGIIPIVLSDKKGLAKGQIAESIATAANLTLNDVGKVFRISAVILADKRQPLVVVKQIAPAEYYIATDIYSGITEEQKVKYKKEVRDAMNLVAHKSYKDLLEACLTEENLERLAVCPASLGFYGTYSGGALASTVGVTYMAMSAMASYVKRGNGFTTRRPEWNVLVTAALLHAFGCVRFFDKDDPFRKSDSGVKMNYFCTLQDSLCRIRFEKSIEIADEEFELLLNILAAATSGRTSVKSVTKEGAVLRSILFLYKECDAVDFALATHEKEENEGEFFYSERLSRYLLTTPIVEEGEEA